MEPNQDREGISTYNRRFFSVVPSHIKGCRVQVQKAGSHFKARFEGRKNFVFGRTKNEAIKNLKYTEN